ncbi:MAG: hypothetical protein QOG03_400 [Actinomycetota bacterium]|nr:hypothetical protein [Actinomycetota bacterium]
MYQRILVGTDGSKTAALAVDRAVEMAAAFGATLTIASAGRVEQATEVVESEAARHAGAGITIETEVLLGEPASELVDLAESQGYDLLVVGNKGMTGASRFFLGSVPNKISHHIHRALLIVRTT